MCWKLFDAIARALFCGMAVVLLTALAIPALIDLGVERELAEETVAPLLSSLIVLLFYFILSAWPRRARKDTYTEVEKKKAASYIFWQSLLVPVFAALIFVPALHLMNAPAWLRSALITAFMLMAAIVAIEWQLLKRGRARGGKR